MTDFNYEMPREFDSRKSQGMKPTGLTYQRFGTVAEAIRFAMEDLPSTAFGGCMLEAGGELSERKSSGQSMQIPDIRYGVQPKNGCQKVQCGH